MKKIITSLAILFLLSASASALCDSTRKFHVKQELGFVFYSNTFNYFPKGGENTYVKPIDNYFVNGLQYKIVVNRKNALRTSFQYTQYVTNFETDPQFGWYNMENSFTKGYEIRAGYERIFCCGKIKPFAFADLSYSYGETRGYHEWSGCFSWGAGNFSQLRNTQGILAGGGVKYFPRRNIFISLETSVAFNFVQSITTNEGYESHHGKSFDLVFNPVKALSFGVKF